MWSKATTLGFPNNEIFRLWKKSYLLVQAKDIRYMVSLYKAIYIEYNIIYIEYI